MQGGCQYSIIPLWIGLVRSSLDDCSMFNYILYSVLLLFYYLVLLSIYGVHSLLSFHPNFPTSNFGNIT